MRHWMRSVAAVALLITAAACGGAGGPGGPGTGDPGNGDPGNGGPSAVTSVTVTPGTGTLAVGDTLLLSATVEPAGASQAVDWSTSSTAVATVDANGVVTGVGPATVTITATSVADASVSGSATLEVECVTYDALNLPTFIVEDTTVPRGCHELVGTKRVTDGATLTFESPAVVRAASDSTGIRVQVGALETLGTDSTPIRFTAPTASPGSWHGFVVSEDGDATFSHTTIEYAGTYSNAFHLFSVNSGIRVQRRGTLTLDTVTIRATQAEAARRGAGLFIEREASVTMLGENRFVENQGPGVAVTASQLHMLSPDGDYGGAAADNGDNVVLVNDDDTSAPPVVAGTRTWPALNVPYRVARSAVIDGSGTVVTIEPGARFEFAEDAGIRVRSDATLRAIGGPSADERIVFTGVDASAGAWPGLHINTDNPTNELRFTEIAFAGQNSLSFNPVGGGGIATSVRVGDGVGSGAGGGQAATLTFVDNVVRQSAGSGIRLEHPDTVITPDVDDLAAENTFDSATIADDDIDDVR